MNRIEQELFDLEEHLRRNDDIADNSAYLTIIGIANKVSELDAENTKLRELVLHTVECVRRLSDTSENGGCVPCPYQSIDYDCEFENRARELGVEVDDG